MKSKKSVNVHYRHNHLRPNYIVHVSNNVPMQNPVLRRADYVKNCQFTIACYSHLYFSYSMKYKAKRNQISNNMDNVANILKDFDPFISTGYMLKNIFSIPSS